jgi:hypothetical protein
MKKENVVIAIANTKKRIKILSFTFSIGYKVIKNTPNVGYTR